MYKNESALRFGSIEPRTIDLPQKAARHNDRTGFIAITCLLITITFIVPFEKSWTQSAVYVENLNADYVDSGTRDGRIDRQIAVGIIGLLGLATVARREGKTLRAPSMLSFLCITYVVWCVATCLWSDDFGLSLRRCTALMCEILGGMAIAKRCSARQFVWIVFTCTFAWLCLGIIAELSLGTFQPWREDYRFAGIFHPNTMGVNCALSIMAALYLATGEQRAGKWLYMFALVTSLFLLLTGSRTALSAMLASIAVSWYFAMPTSRKLGIAIVMLLVASIGWIASSFGVFGDSAHVISLGRTDSDASSFTGRVPLWEALLSEYLPPRQLVGYGYGAFWSESRIIEVSHSQGWSVPHAHSTYIDFVLNTGFIGAALGVSVMVLAMISALRLEGRHHRAGYGFVAMILIFVMTGGLIETYIGMTWLLSMFVISGISQLFYHYETCLLEGGN